LANGGSLLLNGQTLYINGNVLISNNAIVYGPGRIVATGEIEVRNNAQMLGNIDIISGSDVHLVNNGIYETNGNVIYARQDLEIDNNAGIGPKAAILSPHEVTFKNNARAHAFVYGDVVGVSNNALIWGSVYANHFMNSSVPNGYEYVSDFLTNNFTCTYDPDAMTFDVPPGIPKSPPGVRVTLGAWQEVDSVGSS